MNFHLIPCPGTFFPLVGFLVILFLQEEQKNAIRWTALLTSLVTFGLSLWVLAQFNPARPGHAAVAAACPGCQVGGAEISLPHGRGRPEPADGAADHLPDPAGHPLHLDGGQGARQGLHAVLPAARKWA